TDPAWVLGLYQILLGRQADAPSLALWVQYIESGALSRSAVESDIQYSPEALSLDVRNTYRTVLGRDAGQGEISSWEGPLAHGLALEELTAIFTASPEYVAQQQGVDMPFSTPPVPTLVQGSGWVPVGPAPITIQPSSALGDNPGPFSGRITGIAADPQ